MPKSNGRGRPRRVPTVQKQAFGNCCKFSSSTSRPRLFLATAVRCTARAVARASYHHLPDDVPRSLLSYELPSAAGHPASSGLAAYFAPRQSSGFFFIQKADGGALALAIRHQVDDDKLVEPLGEPRGLLGDLGLAIAQRVPAHSTPRARARARASARPAPARARVDARGAARTPRIF